MPVSSSENPYPGLPAFKASGAKYFFGRGTQVARLIEILEEKRIVFVTGNSGCGKSSLVKAGLIPAVRKGFMGVTSPLKSESVGVQVEERTEAHQEERTRPAVIRWECIETRPGSDPFRNLAESLLDTYPATGESLPSDAAPASPPIDKRDKVAAALRMSSLALHQLLDRAHCLRPDQATVVVVDQFEELFLHLQGVSLTGAHRRLRDRRQEMAAEFTDLLIESVRASPQVFLVVTMRTEFISLCDTVLGLPEQMGKCLFVCPRLNRKELRMVIDLPAVEAGFCTSPEHDEFVETVLRDCTGEADELPKLQHCLRLCANDALARCAEGKTPLLIVADYVQRGRIARCLDLHLSRSYLERGAASDQELAGKNSWSSEEEKGVVAQVGRTISFSGGERALTEDQVTIQTLFRMFCHWTPEGTLMRRSVKVSALVSCRGRTFEEVQAVVEFLREEGRSFVIDSGGPAIEWDDDLEVQHESVLRSWFVLGDAGTWSESEREMRDDFHSLLHDAGDHAKGKASFWTGSSLRAAQRWIREGMLELPWIERRIEERATGFSREKAPEAKRLVEGFIRRSRWWEWLRRAAPVAVALGYVVFGVVLANRIPRHELNRLTKQLEEAKKQSDKLTNERIWLTQERDGLQGQKTALEADIKTIADEKTRLNNEFADLNTSAFRKDYAAYNLFVQRIAFLSPALVKIVREKVEKPPAGDVTVEPRDIVAVATIAAKVFTIEGAWTDPETKAPAVLAWVARIENLRSGLIPSAGNPPVNQSRENLETLARATRILTERRLGILRKREAAMKDGIFADMKHWDECTGIIALIDAALSAVDSSTAANNPLTADGLADVCWLRVVKVAVLNIRKSEGDDESARTVLTTLEKDLGNWETEVTGSARVSKAPESPAQERKSQILLEIGRLKVSVNLLLGHLAYFAATNSKSGSDGKTWADEDKLLNEAMKIYEKCVSDRRTLLAKTPVGDSFEIGATYFNRPELRENLANDIWFQARTTFYRMTRLKKLTPRRWKEQYIEAFHDCNKLCNDRISLLKDSVLEYPAFLNGVENGSLQSSQMLLFLADGFDRIKEDNTGVFTPRRKDWNNWVRRSIYDILEAKLLSDAVDSKARPPAFIATEANLKLARGILSKKILTKDEIEQEKKDRNERIDVMKKQPLEIVNRVIDRSQQLTLAWERIN